MNGDAPGPAGASEEPASLQAAFAAFVVSRKTSKSASGKRKKKKGCSAKEEGGNEAAPASPLAVEERRARLRALFVETARKYIGVPYGRKHHELLACACEGCSCSGRQLYHEPLFLDCCGLVRKVARDMQRHLGFRLGRLNQAYQYDTLPVRLEQASQLQPGDLVFYSGSLVEPTSRRHAFDMTHVEIFIGGDSGEATIGSRERYKWVMEYPSYRFESQRWRLIAHHFCSLDPWLDGLCAPQHPELWHARRRGAGGQQQQQGALGAAAAHGHGGAGVQAAAVVPELTWDSSRRYSIFGGGAAGAGAAQEGEGQGGDEQLQSDGDDG
ncbi:hypothetical protein TSOC_002049 [Tetrabaena socialis]|uniref:NlpC/P60 domain-containing protein n=1 Tax=Tetrabaena socialis TaxID=47790 RepID=A0A2J8AF73_9CHLO|nr:hypothetical protein TSOC_002049 [Tetrabaena socialis]|eukprot:PNH11146.1 hypothetical protein TSOC_002049 [Tetrabaena socialis]